MSDNLPTIPNHNEDERRRLAALAEQALKFRRSAADALDELIVTQIQTNTEIGWNKFTTPNGRPCIICLGVGPDATGQLTDAVYYLTHPEEHNHEDEKRDPRE